MDIKLTAADLVAPVIKKELYKSEVEESKAAKKLVMKQEMFKHEVTEESVEDGDQ